METAIQQETGILLNYQEMPAYKGAKEKQELLVAKFPFVPITDASTLKKARESRTALRQGRYDLQNGEKLIASKLKDFRELVKDETTKLIDITLAAENKQQAEIERYEEQKKKEKEEQLKKERERKEALKAQLLGFRNSKSAAIETATINTIASIISDIENTNLEVEEFADDFRLIKDKMIEDANKKKAQLEEDERLRVERQKAAEERRKLEEERKKLEAEKKKQEEAIRKQKEAEAAKLKAEREAEQAKLKAEREKLEKEKAELAKAEAKRKAKLEAEEKARKEKELTRRIEAVKELGFSYNEITREFTYESLVCEISDVEIMDEEGFENRLIPEYKRLLDDEKRRFEEIKPDKQKLMEIVGSFDTESFKETKLLTVKARKMLNRFLTDIEDLKAVYENEIYEL